MPNGFSPTVNWTVSGGVAPYTMQITWGDGASSGAIQQLPGAGALSHTYANSGIYTVNVAATDSGDQGSHISTATASIGVTINPVSLSGLVTTYTGTPLSGVSLNLQLAGAAKQITTTVSNGTYTFTNVSPGTYSILASKSGSTFNTPAISNIVVDGTANVTGVNFSALPPPAPVNVVGTVTQSNGTTVISGVSLQLKLAGVTKYLATTGNDGRYTFATVANGSYTISAAKNTVTFANPAASVVVSGVTVTVNFSSLTP